MGLTVLKLIHITAVAVSYALFFMRGIWMIDSSPRSFSTSGSARWR